jgi:dTDP-4-dehydrorhamnose reductase
VRVLITGATGQLARALLQTCARRGVAAVAAGRPDFDLTDPAGVAAHIARTQPSIVVNAAAYTNVDKGETEPGLAHAINGEGAGVVAAACDRLGIPIIQLSTDYVFDGTKVSPYAPDNRPAPLNIYGQSKWEGERRVIAGNGNHIILRTAWLYSPYGSNFVTTILRLAATKEEVAVVNDQVGNPTYATHLADAITGIALQAVRDGVTDRSGIYHAAGCGVTTWCGLAEEVLRCSSRLGGPSTRVRAISSANYATAARRPANSQLDCGSLERAFGTVLPPWRAGVRDCVVRLLEGRGATAPIFADGGSAR